MRAMSGVLSHSGRPNSEARVTLSRYIVSRSLRSSAYCITGRYDGACSVNFQPALPSACAASRAACSTSSGSPAILFSSTTTENALVASSRFSENFAPSRASSSWIAAKRAFPSGGSSAPPRRKSRSALSTIFRLAFDNWANSGESRSALYFSNSAWFCPSSVQYWETFGRLAL